MSEVEIIHVMFCMDDDLTLYRCSVSIKDFKLIKASHGGEINYNSEPNTIAAEQIMSRIQQWEGMTDTELLDYTKQIKYTIIDSKEPITDITTMVLIKMG